MMLSGFEIAYNYLKDLQILNFPSRLALSCLCIGMQVPAGAWHTIEVLEPSVIFEAKDGAYLG